MSDEQNIDPHADVRQAFEAAEDVDLGETPPAPPVQTSGDDMPPPPPPHDEPEGPPPPEAEACRFPLNDIGNGKRLVHYFGDDLMFVPRVGWFRWTGKVWSKDDDELEVRGIAHMVSERILEEVKHVRLEDWEYDLLTTKSACEAQYAALQAKPIEELTDQDKKDRLDLSDRLNRIAEVQKRRSSMRRTHKAHAKSAGNSASIKNMMIEASVSLRRALDEIDAAPLDINTESGVLRFSVARDPEEGMSAEADVRLIPHHRDLLLSKIMPVEYDPDAKCPKFEAFLERVQPIPEMRHFLQRWMGLSMTAFTGDQKLAFLYGGGANGKSVLVDLIARMLGTYSATAKIESLTGNTRRGGGDATPDLIPLMGARFVRASEPEQGERLKEGTIKELTGGEPILVRALHSDFVEVKPQFKLTISGNHKPEVRGNDDGIWRRLLLVPFEVQIPEDERDPDLGVKLWEERSGILNWMVDGLLAYLERGLAVPDQVSAATQLYREESDPLGIFLGDCCLVTGSEEDYARSKEIVDAYNYWLEASGQTRWKERTIQLQLSARAGVYKHPTTARSYMAHRRSGIAGYLGLKLTDTFRRQMEEDTGRYSGSSGSSATSPHPSNDPF